MPKVSLTIFVDFLLSTGSQRMRRLREWVDGPGYDRKFDFWAKMRDWIVEVEGGQLAASDFKKRTKGVTSSKIRRYEETAKGFLKFTRTNRGQSLRPPRGEWSYGDLTLIINPELAYEIAGHKLAVKLYMKSNRLSGDKAALIGEIMRNALPGFEPRLLDVKSGRLIIPSRFPDMEVLLRAEALAFTEVWKGINPERVPDDLRKASAKPQTVLESELATDDALAVDA
jgi:hypothetical protein